MDGASSGWYGVPPMSEVRNPVERDVPRLVLGVLCMGALIASSAWIMVPFLPAIVWATMIVVATWPMLLRVQARLGGRRGRAVAVMTILLVLLFIVPLGTAVIMVVDHADDLAGFSKSLAQIRPPAPPEWVAKVPLVGGEVQERWKWAAAASPEEMSERLLPHSRAAAAWLVGKIGGFGRMAIHFLLTVILAAILYARGETAASGVRRFARRLAGDRGDHSIVLAGQAIRAVALGVIVTAVVQAVIAGIGLAAAGVPYPGLLTAVVFLLGIAQVGGGLVLVGATIWLFSHDATGWGIAMIAWTIIVSAVDNVLRPFLIRQGADLPLLLIMAGVIGGLVGFGMIGLFAGPVILAISYTLLVSWIELGEDAAEAGGEGPREPSRAAAAGA